jgi:hypothetical protein
MLLSKIAENTSESEIDGGMAMKFSSFLMGGIVGAAAVMYLSGRNKSMLWSALTSSGSLGNMMNQTNDRADANKANFNGLSPFANSGNQARGMTNGNNANNANNSNQTNAAGNNANNSNQTNAAGNNANNSNQTNAASPASNLKKNGAKQNADGMYKVSDIVNQDPKLKSQVQEIMANGSQKEQHQLQ